MGDSSVPYIQLGVEPDRWTTRLEPGALAVLALRPSDCRPDAEAERSCLRHHRAMCERSGFLPSRFARLCASILADHPRSRYRRSRMFWGAWGRLATGTVVPLYKGDNGLNVDLIRAEPKPRSGENLGAPRISLSAAAHPRRIL